MDRVALISVLVITYNHEAHIAKALNSVLAQVTSSPFEVIVSEDASTDGTREIVERYAARRPETIRLILSESNVRSNAVVARGLRAARGRYVALLDGDDYWLWPGKLQAQAEFLDEHPDCAMCCHNAVVVRGEQETGELWTWPGTPAFSSLADIWRGNFIATCTVMLRREAVADIGPWYDAYFPVTDWPLYIYAAERGQIGFIDQPWGAYRLHAGGLYSSLPEPQKLAATDSFYRRMDRDRGFRHTRIARAAHSAYFFEWTERLLAEGDLQMARWCFNRSLVAGGLHRAKPWKAIVMLAAALWAKPLLKPGAPAGGAPS